MHFNILTLQKPWVQAVGLELIGFLASCYYSLKFKASPNIWITLRFWNLK